MFAEAHTHPALRGLSWSGSIHALGFCAFGAGGVCVLRLQKLDLGWCLFRTQRTALDPQSKMGKVSVYGNGIHVCIKKTPKHPLHTLPEMVCWIFHVFHPSTPPVHFLQLKVHSKIACLKLAVAVSGKACFHCLNIILRCWKPSRCWNRYRDFIVPVKRSRSC